MIGFSTSEALVVVLFGVLFLGPKELPVVVRFIRNIFIKTQKFIKDLIAQIIDESAVDDIAKIAEDLNNDLETIIDLEGKPRQRYKIYDNIYDNDDDLAEKAEEAEKEAENTDDSEENTDNSDVHKSG